MGVDTSAAIERLTERIDVLIGTVREEVPTMPRDVGTMPDDLRTEIRNAFAENRRHTEMLFGILRDGIRALTASVASVSTKLDSLQR